MQSSGGLTDAHRFQGKDAILSGPAGGIVGAVEVSRLAGFDRIIGFDMGGTSTDVTHWAGEYERAFVTEVAGVRLRAPMMSIHTVAAGGGSICTFDGARLRVGPQSAGANPGPASYRRGGPLTVTDCNVMVGKLDPALFPQGVRPARRRAARRGRRARQVRGARRARSPRGTGHARTPEEVADGFLDIAVENMANAIKHISVQRGYDVTGTRCARFGGAGGQHACLVADALGMRRVFIHPLAGVLSAYGMGLADVRALRQQAVEARLTDAALAACDAAVRGTGRQRARAMSLRPGHRGRRASGASARCTSSTTAPTRRSRSPRRTTPQPSIAEFERRYRQQYGFLMPGKPLVIEAIAVEAIGKAQDVQDERPVVRAARRRARAASRPIAFYTEWRVARRRRVTRATDLRPGDAIDGPAVIREPNATTVIEPGWRATLTARDHLVLERVVPIAARARDRHRRRSGAARGVQQPVHGDRRADGRDAREHGVLGQHQGAPRFLLRAVRRAKAT